MAILYPKSARERQRQHRESLLRQDAERETPIEDFGRALYLATNAVASVVLGDPLAYATVCPGWGAGTTWDRRGYRPVEYATRICHDDEPEDGTTEASAERIERMAVLAEVRINAEEEPTFDMVASAYHGLDAATHDYERAGGFGTRPDADWPEFTDADDCEAADNILMEWHDEQVEMFKDRVVGKAREVVRLHRKSILRVAVALCYHGTLSGAQVREIVRRTRGGIGAAARSL